METHRPVFALFTPSFWLVWGFCALALPLCFPVILGFSCVSILLGCQTEQGWGKSMRGNCPNADPHFLWVLQSPHLPEVSWDGWCIQRPTSFLLHLLLLAVCPTVSYGCSSHSIGGRRLWGQHGIHRLTYHHHVKHWCTLPCLLSLLVLCCRCSSFFSLRILHLQNLKETPWDTCEAV